MQPTQQCTVKKPYMRFNPQTGMIEQAKRGDVIYATEIELKEFPDCLELNHGGEKNAALINTD